MLEMSAFIISFITLVATIAALVLDSIPIRKRILLAASLFAVAVLSFGCGMTSYLVEETPPSPEVVKDTSNKQSVQQEGDNPISIGQAETIIINSSSSTTSGNSAETAPTNGALSAPAEIDTPMAPHTSLPTYTPTASPAPTDTVEPPMATSVLPADTPIPEPTPTVPPPPTSTPIPSSPGIGDRIGSEQLDIELISVEFHPNQDPEEAAVEYQLTFHNKTQAAMDVQFSLEGVTGFDNKGTTYYDYYSYNEKACHNSYALRRNPWTEYIPQAFSIDPGVSLTQTYYLAKEKSGCEKVSRVDIDTDWIEITLPTIKHRATKFETIEGATWRLIR